MLDVACYPGNYAAIKLVRSSNPKVDHNIGLSRFSFFFFFWKKKERIFYLEGGNNIYILMIYVVRNTIEVLLVVSSFVPHQALLWLCWRFGDDESAAFKSDSSRNNSLSPYLHFKMAGFLRGKQSGIQNDLSSAILPGLFAPDDQARYGINSQIGFVGSVRICRISLTFILHLDP